MSPVNDTFSQRRERLVRALHKEHVDALLISNPVNVGYLTGFTGESSYLLLSSVRSVLVSDGRFTTQLAEECPGLETHIRKPITTLPEAIGKLLGQFTWRTVGYESAHLTVAELETLSDNAKEVSWKGGRDRVEKLRAIKDAREIEQIRQAIVIAERAFAMFRAMLQGEDREKDLCDALDNYIRRAGGKGSSFPPIVAVGPRAALPHAPPSAHRVNESDLLLIDWGASGPFYKSDLTRVLARHKTSESSKDNGQAKLQRVYEVVLQAQRRALEALRPGAKAGEVDAAARGVITEAGFGDYFTHSTGHGLGLQVHEAPLLKPGSEAVLQAGMVVTVEPGIYLPEWGGVRIEDDVLITPDGCSVLTSVPKQLTEMLCDW